jgi:hypothetical protein
MGGHVERFRDQEVLIAEDESRDHLRRGALHFNPGRDLPMILAVRNAAFISHGQLFSQLVSQGTESNRQGFCWRLKRLVDTGLIHRLTQIMPYSGATYTIILVLAYLENRDQAFWNYLSQPTRPGNLREALTKFEKMANLPEIIGCPFLRIASEFPDPAHPFHRVAIEHQNQIVDYLTGLLEPFAVDKKAAAAAILGVIDGALSLRMLYGNSKMVPILSPAEAVLRDFQSARAQHRR